MLVLDTGLKMDLVIIPLLIVCTITVIWVKYGDRHLPSATYTPSNLKLKTISYKLSVELQVQLVDEKHLTKLNDNNDCVICLKQINCSAYEKSHTTINPKDADACLATCDHILHFGCLFKWLSNKPTCPICRGKQTIEDCQILKSGAIKLTAEQSHSSSQNVPDGPLLTNKLEKPAHNITSSHQEAHKETPLLAQLVLPTEHRAQHAVHSSASHATMDYQLASTAINMTPYYSQQLV